MLINILKANILEKVIMNVKKYTGNFSYKNLIAEVLREKTLIMSSEA